MPEHSYATGGPDFQRLQSIGFTASEAERLLHMKEQVSEQMEYREMLQESHHLSFLRWLVDHDRMSR
jgi:hypothetical protein